MIVDRRRETIDHSMFRNIGDYLRPGDCLVVNDTKVLPARLLGRRLKTGGRWEGLFLESLEPPFVKMMTKTRGSPALGETIEVEGSSRRLAHAGEIDGATKIELPSGTSIDELLAEAGRVPLPPYIRRGQESPIDRERYQTIFANRPGSAAAPTAGLHFTPKLLDSLRRAGVLVERITLHVGVGTFQPIKTDDISKHVMHRERCEIEVETARRLTAVKRAGGRIVAVGTTSARTLESALQLGRKADNGGANSTTVEIPPFNGSTDLYVRPGFRFEAVDSLITNFHVPKSSLIVLVSTFADRKLMRRAYAEAIERRYRFFSYGDAMLIV
jgi:S-adenosylmethionine:tRNA ribosyltransferase-isomerase